MQVTIHFHRSGAGSREQGGTNKERNSCQDTPRRLEAGLERTGRKYRRGWHKNEAGGEPFSACRPGSVLLFYLLPATRSRLLAPCYPSYFARARQALVPPNPKELERA